MSELCNNGILMIMIPINVIHINMLIYFILRCIDDHRIINYASILLLLCWNICLCSKNGHNTYLCDRCGVWIYFIIGISWEICDSYDHDAG